MKKNVLSLILAFAICLSFSSVAWADSSELNQNLNSESNAVVQEITISSLTEEDFDNNETLKKFLDKVNSVVNPIIPHGSPHYTTKTFDRLYYVQDIDPTGNVYDYYISPTLVTFCNDIISGEEWYTRLSIVMATYLNGLEVSNSSNKLSLRNLRAEMAIGSEYVYFTGLINPSVRNKSSGSAISINWLSVGAAIVPSSYKTAALLMSLLSSISLTETSASNAESIIFEKNAVAVGFEDQKLSTDGAYAELSANVSIYNYAQHQDATVAFRWTYDIYLNNKHDSSRVLGTSDQFIVKP